MTTSEWTDWVEFEVQAVEGTSVKMMCIGDTTAVTFMFAVPNVSSVPAVGDKFRLTPLTETPGRLGDHAD